MRITGSVLKYKIQFNLAFRIVIRTKIKSNLQVNQKNAWRHYIYILQAYLSQDKRRLAIS